MERDKKDTLRERDRVKHRGRGKRKDTWETEGETECSVLTFSGCGILTCRGK
jgi:hypothetical protein